jgi:hypothetical protein
MARGTLRVIRFGVVALLGLAGACSARPVAPLNEAQDAAQLPRVAGTSAARETAETTAPTPNPSATYIADTESSTTAAGLSALPWPLQLPDANAPAECLRRREPTVLTCRHPNDATQRLAQLLIDAYRDGRLDRDATPCDATRSTRNDQDKQRALDRALVELEGCAQFPQGFIRALRAHEDPKCADALLASPLRAALGPDATTPSPIASHWLELMYGQTTAAILERWFRHRVTPVRSSKPPELDAWRSRVQAPYLTRGRDRLERARQTIEHLPALSAGRAVATHALWLAELRMLRNLRAVAIPETLKRDYASRTRFYGHLDLDARDLIDAQTRDMRDDCLRRAELGWMDDLPYHAPPPASGPLGEPRCSPFVELPLPFPIAPSQVPASADEPLLSLASTLPPAFIDVLLSNAQRADPGIHRALLARGVPRVTRQFASTALAASPPNVERATELHLALARSDFRLALQYWSPRALARAKYELEFALDTAETGLLRALTSTLLTAHPVAAEATSEATCLAFDSRALVEFTGASAVNTTETKELAHAAVARLSLECPRDRSVENVHSMLEHARAGGAFFVEDCWYAQLPEARPFTIQGPGHCRTRQHPRCLAIPWQGW